MAAITSGVGLGLYHGSLTPQAGQQATLGQNGNRVYVNSTTGNLVIQQQDEFLSSLGLDLGLVRTYNSQGQFDDDNGDNWRLNVNQRLHSLTGTVNTASSTITKVFGDGFESVYTYDVGLGLYVSTDGDGPHDTLSYDDTTLEWTWTDGTPNVEEVYDVNGQLLRTQDSDSNAITYTYTGNLITQITDASGQVTEFIYVGNNLAEIRVVNTRYIVQSGDTWARIANQRYGTEDLADELQTLYGDAALVSGNTLTSLPATLTDIQTSTSYDLIKPIRTRYSYDVQDRLSQVTVDLSPDDGKIVDGITYVTTYTYDGTSTRIASITGGDGTTTAFTYDADSRIETITDGAGQVTRMDYHGGTSLENIERIADPTVLTQPAPGSWSGPVGIDSTVTGVNKYKPQIVFDDSGHGYAVWTQDDSGEHNLYASRYVDGGWQAAIPLDTDTAQVDSPQLKLDPQGNAVVVWRQSGAAGSIFVSRYDVLAQTWSTAEAIGNGPWTTVNPPQLALNNNGDAIVSWYQSGDLYASRYSGQIWSPPELVQSGVYYFDSQIYLADNGDAMLAWVQSDGTNLHLFASEFDATTQQWSSGSQIESTPGSLQGSVQGPLTYGPQWSTDAQGNHVMVWNMWDATNGYTAYAMHYDNGVWGTPVPLASDAYAPQIAINASGRAMAIWTQADGLYASERLPGETTWGTAFKVTGTTMRYHQVAIDAEGNAAVLWTAGLDDSVYVRRYTVATGWEATEALETITNPSETPKLYMSAGGRISTTWVQADQTADDYRVFVDIYNPSISAAPYYVVQVGDTTWNDIANAVYHDASADAANTLRVYFAQQGITAFNVGDPLIVPDTLTYGTVWPKVRTDVSASHLDDLGRIIATENLDGTVTAYRYDTQGRISEVKTYTAPSTTITPQWLWQQDFSVDSSGFVQLYPGYTDVVNGQLEIYNVNQASTASGSIFGARIHTIEQSLTFRTEVTTSASADSRDVIVGIVGDKGSWPYQQHTLQLKGDRLISQYAELAGNPLQSQTHPPLLKNSTTYVFEQVVGKTGTTIYFYEKGQMRDSGIIDHRDSKNWQQAQLIITLKAGPDVTPNTTIFDNFSEAVGNPVADLYVQSSATDSRIQYLYDEQGRVGATRDAQGQVATYQYDANDQLTGLRQHAQLPTPSLWKQDFSVVTDGLIFRGDPMPIVNGQLAVSSINQATSLWPAAYRTDTHAFSEQVTYQADITMGASSVGRNFNIGIDDNTGRHAIEIRDNIVSITTDNGPTFSRYELGLVTDNTTYTFELVTHETGTTLYLYEKGQPRDSGLIDTFHYTDWGDAKLWVWTYAGPTAVNNTVYVDNMLELPQYDHFIDGYTILDDAADVVLPVGNHTTTVTDAKGNITSYTTDADSRLIAIQTPAIDGSRHTSQYQYDSDGNLSAITDANGNVTEQGYNPDGTLAWQQDAEGNRREYAYDANGLLVNDIVYRSEDPDGITGPLTATDPVVTRYVYDSESHLRFTVSAEGRISEQRYNVAGQRIASLVYTADHYDVSALLETDSLSETELATWVAGLIDKTNALRSDYSYDFRGNLASTTTYASLDATGAGLLDGKQSTTQFIYDQAGQLLQSIDAKGVASTGDLTDGISQFTYDGLGRLLTTTDALGRLTVNNYDDVNNRIATTLANGLTTTHVYDARGLLVSTVQSATDATPLGTTSYIYDERGQLKYSQDPLGRRSHILYDEAGRTIASIDNSGALSETVYDQNNNIIQVISYGQALSDTTLPLDALRNEASNADDRSVTTLYDKANRPVMVITTSDTDPNVGYVSQNFYDGAGRVTDVIQYATAVDISALEANSLPDDISIVPDAVTDRHSRTFYSDDGLVIGSLDAEGYVTGNVYDKAGRVIETIAYANPLTDAALHSSGDFAAIKTAIGTHPADRHAYSLYNGRGQVAGTVDADGYLTETGYDLNGNVTDVTRYDRVISYTPGQSLAAIRPTASATDQVTVNTYTALNQVETVTNSVTNTTSQYQYDEVGNLVATTSGLNTSDIRTVRVRYDAAGRVTGELTPQGNEQLELLLQGVYTQADIDTLWASYGISHDYDIAGRRLSTVDQVGGKTWYYYDEAGRLSVTIQSADGGLDETGQLITNQGEVTRSTYNTFGQVVDTTVYANRIDTTGLAGGDEADIATQLTALGDAINDSTTQVNYTLRGAVKQAIDAMGYRTENTYTAFGELETLIQQHTLPAGDNINPLTTGVGGDSLMSRFVYDQRGLQTETYQDTAGLNRHSQTEYDAFGRVTQSIDGNGIATTISYGSSTEADTVGRQIVTTSRAGLSTVTTYDAFGRTLRLRDANGNVTRYDYGFDTTLRTQTLTVTTPEGIVTTNETNAHGEIVRLTDGNGVVTQYVYDVNGNLDTVTEALGTADELITSDNAYDNANRLIETKDANGVITTIYYDAANRLIERIVDPLDVVTNPDGLNLTTSTQYDAKGQVLTTTDANGTVTETRYDNNGQVTDIIVDPTSHNPNGLNLHSTFTYDGLGNTLTVTDGVGAIDVRTTEYRYDGLNRRTHTIVDPGTGSLNLTTQTKYDQNDNVVVVIDANYHVTRYVYDAQNRLQYSVDAEGGITKSIYDNNGNVVRSIAYANAMDVTGLPNQISEAQIVINAEPAADQVTYFAYDTDNRHVFSVDALGTVSANFYDNYGQVVSQVIYADPLDAATLASLDTLPVEQHQGVIAQAVGLPTLPDLQRDQVTHHYYDALNRLRISVDTGGYATQLDYDVNGNVITTTAYAQVLDRLAIVNATDQELEVRNQLQQRALNPDNRISNNVYDAANHLRFSIDALGYVSETQYDNIGQLTHNTRYATKLNGDAILIAAGIDITGLSVEQKRALWPSVLNESSIALGISVTTSKDQTTAYQHDRAGRLEITTDAKGNKEYYGYDASGNKVWYTNQKGSGPEDVNYTWRYEYDQANRLTKEITPAVDVTRLTENHDSSVSETTAPENIVTFMTYDGNGNVTTRTEAYGTVDARTTTYVYDKLGQQIKTLFPGERFNVVVSRDRNAGVVGPGITETVITWPDLPIVDETIDPSSPVQPQIAYDAQGNAIAIWQQSDGSYNHIYASRYDEVNGWQDVQRLDTATESAGEPQITFDGQGNALVVWRQFDSTNASGIHARFYDVVYGWQASEVLDSRENFASSPQIAMDNQGNAIVVWSQSDGYSSSIYSNRFQDGVWQGTELLEAETGIAGDAQAAFDSSGNIIAVWRQTDGTSYNIYAKRHNISTGWQAEQRIDSGTSDAYEPQIAIDGLGNAIVVWTQPDGTSNNIYSNRFALGVGWQGVQLLETDTNYAYKELQIAIDAKGNAIAVWVQNDDIYANRYQMGSGWQGTELLETGTGVASKPRIIFDVHGNATAVWMQSDGITDSIYVNRYVTRSGWQGVELRETTTVAASEPQITVDSDGNPVVIWVQNDGTSNSLNLHRFAKFIQEPISTWEKLPGLDEVVVGSPVDAKISYDAKGNAIAVWQQADGYSYSVYANRYDVDLGWLGAQLLETDQFYAIEPEIVMDAQGNAMVMWLQDDLFVRRYDIATGWESAQIVSSGEPSIIGGQSIAMDDQGNVIVVWSLDGIYVNRYNGTTWQGVELLETGGGGATQIAFDKQGNAMVVWSQYDGTEYNIYSKRYEAGLGWQGVQLMDSGVGYAENPKIDFDGLGNAIVLWSQNGDVYAKRYEAGIGWQLEQLLETGASSAGNIRLTVNDQGHAMAAWLQHDGTSTNLYTNRYVAGIGWQRAESLKTNVSSNAIPSIALDDQGDAMVVWMDHDPTTYIQDQVYSRRYRADYGWQTVEILAMGAFDDPQATEPKVTTDEKGNFVVMWVQDNGTTNSLFLKKRTKTYTVPDYAKITPTSTTYYDSFGNAVANRDVAGNFSYKLYDTLGRLRFEIDAERYVTEYTYDAFSNQATLTRYATALNETASIHDFISAESSATDTEIGVPSEIDLLSMLAVDATQDRTLTSLYNTLDQLIETQEEEVYNFDSSETLTGNKTFTVSPTTKYEYDAFGQVIKQSQLKNNKTNTWIDTYFYYDNNGQNVAQVDALGYVTEYEYDASGNLEKQTEYAKALDQNSWNTTTYVTPDGTLPTLAEDTSDTGFDRITRFDYDQLNRKVAEVQEKVIVAEPTYTGIVDPNLQLKEDVITSYTYDEVGNLTSTTDPSEATTFTSYDVLGRVIATKEPTRSSESVVSSALPVLHLSQLYLDVDTSSAAWKNNTYWSGQSEVALKWSSLGMWGAGNVRVRVDYTAKNGYNHSKAMFREQVLSRVEWESGYTFTLSNGKTKNLYNDLQSVNRVQVWKEINGVEVLIHDSVADTYQGAILSWERPPIADTQVSLTYQRRGAAASTAVTISNLDSIEQRGGLYWVDLDALGLTNDQYEYSLSYTRPGESVPYAQGTGHFEVTSLTNVGSSQVVDFVEESVLDVVSTSGGTWRDAYWDGYIFYDNRWTDGSHVDLVWSNLEEWGSGDVRVRIDYTALNGTGQSTTTFQQQVLSAVEGMNGVSFNWGQDSTVVSEYNNMTSLDRVQVWKVVDGLEVLVHDSLGVDKQNPERLVLLGQTAGLTSIDILGVGTRAATTLGGGVFTVDVSDLGPGRYTYTPLGTASAQANTFEVHGGGVSGSPIVQESIAYIDVVSTSGGKWRNAGWDGYIYRDARWTDGSHVDLSWNSLEGWGDGDVRVQIEYTAKNGNNQSTTMTQEQVLSAVEGIDGASFNWGLGSTVVAEYNNLTSLDRVQVWKVVDGVEVLMHDSSGDVYSPRLDIILPADATKVVVKYRPLGSNTAYQQRVATPVGTRVFSLAYGDIANGRYDYQLVVDGVTYTYPDEPLEIKRGGETIPLIDAGQTSVTTPLTPLTTFKQDIFGNTNVTIRHANGADALNASPNDEYSYSFFDDYNNLTTSIDAEGHATNYSYDLFGNVRSEWYIQTNMGDARYIHTNVGNAQKTLNRTFEYDALGNQIETFDVNKNVRINTTYNAFAEITSKGLDGGNQEFYEYDKLGRVYRTNQGDGVNKVYFYNLQGNITAEIRSNTVDLTLDTYINPEAVHGLLDTDVVRTNSVYDELGRLVEQQQPDFTITKSLPDSIDAALKVAPRYLDIVSTSGGAWRDGGWDGYTFIESIWTDGSHVDLSWSNLEEWGNGDVRVRIDYTALNGTNQSTTTFQEQILNAADGMNGTSFNWGQDSTVVAEFNNLTSLDRIQVWKVVDGVDVLLHDSTADSYEGAVLSWRKPAIAGTEVTLRYGLEGSDPSVWTSVSNIGLGELKERGSVYWLDVSGLANNRYGYELEYRRAGEPDIYASGSGSFVVSSQSSTGSTHVVGYVEGSVLDVVSTSGGTWRDGYWDGYTYYDNRWTDGSHVALSWSSLEDLGEGDVRVRIDYTALNGTNQSTTTFQEQILSAVDGMNGISFNWGQGSTIVSEYNNMTSLDRVQVWKVVDGVDVLLHDSIGDTMQQRLILRGNTIGLTGVDIAGVGVRTATSLGGDVYAVSVGDLAGDTYSYTALGTAPSQGGIFEMRGNGTLNAQPVVQENVAYVDLVSTSSDAAWSGLLGASWSGENHVALKWNDLTSWGTGDVKVRLDYTARRGDGVNGVNFHEQSFSAVEGATGATLNWGAVVYNNVYEYVELTGVSRIQVWKVVAGVDVLVLDSSGDAYEPRLDIMLPADAASVTFKYRLVGSEAEFQQRLADPLSTRVFGLSYNDIAIGRYEYQLIVDGVTHTFTQPLEIKHGGQSLVLANTEEQFKKEPALTQSHDRWGNLLSQTNAKAQTTTFQYNHLNQVIKETKPLVTAFEANNTSQERMPETYIYYDVMGRQVATIDDYGRINSAKYDKAGNLVAEYHADGGIVRYSYDALGHMVSKTDGNNNTTEYFYDKNNQLIEERRGALSTLYEYDEAGNRTAVTNPLLERTEYFYDSQGNVIRTRLPMGAGRASSRFYTAASYDAFGNKTSETNGSGWSQSWEYDYFGQMIGHTDLGGRHFSYEYNSLGLRVREYQDNGVGKDIRTEYYNNGLVKRIYDFALKTETYYEYDIKGNRLRERFTDLKSGNVYQDTRLTYDTHDRIKTIKDTRYELTYSYDRVGNRRNIHTKYFDTTGQTPVQDHWYEYDEMNRIVTAKGVMNTTTGVIETNPEQGIRLQYDANGNRAAAISYEGGLEVTESYVYDAFNQLEYTHRGGMETSRRIYDGAGRVITYLTYSSPDTISERRETSYDVNGRTRRIQNYDADGINTTTIRYDLFNSYDVVGNLYHYAVDVHVGTRHTKNFSYIYEKFDSFKEKQVDGHTTAYFQYGAGNSDGSTFNTYDVNGNLIKVVDEYGEVPTRNFVLNNQGQILLKTQGSQRQFYFYANGQSIGSVGDIDGNNFDYNYTPVSDRYPSSTPGSHVYAEGETLQSIAMSAYGDASLWYLIADANGISSEADLKVGQTIKIPNQITNLHNDSTTFKPYNPNAIIGDLTPTVPFPDPPPPPRKRGGFFGGILGSILIIVVTIVIAYYTQRWDLVIDAVGKVGAAMIGAAAGNLAGQGVGIAAGIQEGINWKSVATSALTTGITKGLGDGLFGVAKGNIGIEMANAAGQNFISQGISIVVGEQASFNWKGLVASTIAAPITNRFMGDGKAADKFTVEGFTHRIGTEMAKGVVNQGVNMVLGNRGKMDISQIAADAFGNAIGNSIVAHQKYKDNEAESLKAQKKLASMGLRSVIRNDGSLKVMYNPDDYVKRPSPNRLPIPDPVPGGLELTPVIRRRKIKARDSFSSIARDELGPDASEAAVRYRAQQLMQANPGLDPRRLQIDSEINLASADTEVKRDTIERYNKSNSEYQAYLKEQRQSLRPMTLDEIDAKWDSLSIDPELDAMRGNNAKRVEEYALDREFADIEAEFAGLSSEGTIPGTGQGLIKYPNVPAYYNQEPSLIKEGLIMLRDYFAGEHNGFADIVEVTGITDRKDSFFSIGLGKTLALNSNGDFMTGNVVSFDASFPYKNNVDFSFSKNSWRNTTLELVMKDWTHGLHGDVDVDSVYRPLRLVPGLDVDLGLGIGTNSLEPIDTGTDIVYPYYTGMSGSIGFNLSNSKSRKDSLGSINISFQHTTPDQKVPIEGGRLGRFAYAMSDSVTPSRANPLRVATITYKDMWLPTVNEWINGIR